MSGHIGGILAAARDITVQKRLEEQLRDQQNYSRGLIEASVDALMTVDPNGVISDVNEQTVRLTGYPRKHLIGSPFAEYFTDPGRAMAGVHKTFAENVVTDYELIVRSKAGRKITVSFNAAMFRDSSGTVQGILAGARDITQQKKIEQELREQQTYTRGLIESNIDALMTTDTLGIITDVNRQMCKITGQTREELIGTPFKTYFTDPLRAEDGIRRVLAEDQVTNYELTIRATDGRETVVSYNATTFKGADGRLRGVFAAARDITEQKRLEEQITTQYRELSETSTFLNNILESSTEYSIIAKDIKGNILKWNEGAHRTYGYTADEMVGKQNSRILHTQADIESGRVDEALLTAFQTGKFEGEFQRVRKNGEQFTAQVAITLRRNAVGNPIGYVLISKDITEQKALKEQIRRKNEELEEHSRRVQAPNRLKSEFLANMSHELRSPLNSIIGFAQLMYDGKVGPMADHHKEFLGDILTSSNHLLQLINDVLDLAKVESGKMEFHPERVELKKLASEVCVVLRQLAANKRIYIESIVDASLSEVVTDPAKLKQVLYNFLSNAIKFTPEGGHVTLRILPEDGEQFRLEVEDTGIGIKQEDFSRLFVEFQQLDASTAKKYQGTGLGLALTKRIAESQGGRVGMKSELGKGSVFFAVLPRVLNAGSQTNAISGMSSPIQLQPASSEYPRILVVEDSPIDLAWLQATLGQAGYQVQTAQTGKEAMDLVMRQPFDVITMDLRLPDLSGSEVLKAIRTQGVNRDTPVVVLTVVADRSLVGEYEIYDILGKPVEAECLLHTLRRARMPRHKERPVLIIDDDPSVLKQLMGPFTDRGYRAILETDAEQALRAAENENPAAVILDLRMPGLDGFHFLSRFRTQEQFRHVPVIVWTILDLTEEQHKELNAMTEGVVKKEGGLAALLAKFDALLKPYAKKKAA